MRVQFNRFYRNYGKSIADILFCSISLVFCVLPFLIIIVLILIFLGRPIFFIQKRPGKNGKIFSIYKFRTMTDGKDAQGYLLSDHERLTTFGHILRKTSLDELPQLLNVLKGDLSIIGPRPLLVDYLPLYNDFQRRRHEVKPGITGWAQVNGRNALSWNEKFKLDIWYVDNISFCLDIKILFLTFFKVFKSNEISSGTSETMEKFTGN
jgi:lipopolysaccharide/colanic/teichoic acid biosynthesis glycosyltransferase